MPDNLLDLTSLKETNNSILVANGSMWSTPPIKNEHIVWATPPTTFSIKASDIVFNAENIKFEGNVSLTTEIERIVRKVVEEALAKYLPSNSGGHVQYANAYHYTPTSNTNYIPAIHGANSVVITAPVYSYTVTSVGNSTYTYG